MNRLGQIHVVVYFWGAVAILAFLWFRPQIVYFVNIYLGTYGLAQQSVPHLFSDDLYSEINYSQLYKQYVRNKTEIHKVLLQK